MKKATKNDIRHAAGRDTKAILVSFSLCLSTQEERNQLNNKEFFFKCMKKQPKSSIRQTWRFKLISCTDNVRNLTKRLTNAVAKDVAPVKVMKKKFRLSSDSSSNVKEINRLTKPQQQKYHSIFSFEVLFACKACINSTGNHTKTKIHIYINHLPKLLSSSNQFASDPQKKTQKGMSTTTDEDAPF